jgi:hypothetical protein
MGERSVQTIIIMGISFRGQASRFKKDTSSRNQAGFQEKSAAGPRQGVGGDQPNSLAKAEKRFGKKNNISSKTSPITQKSKGSPLKISNALVNGAALTGKKFVDVASEVGKAFENEEEGAVVDLGNGNDKKKGVTKKDSEKKPIFNNPLIPKKKDDFTTSSTSANDFFTPTGFKI